MNRNHRVPKRSNHRQPSENDLFEVAVTRLEAGESIDTILASAPAALRDELADHLRIVQVANQIRQRPVPRSNATTRIAAKQNFLRAAAQMREQHSPAAAPARTNRVRSVDTRKPHTSPLERLVGGFQSLFAFRSLRLAPLLALIAVVVLSTSSFVALAQTAVPGDLAYGFKQWIRQQELELAPASQREVVRLAQELELAEDVKKAAAKADINSAIIQAHDTQIYYGRSGRLLKIGGLIVMDRYQPDANREVFEQIEIEGDLQPGSLVDLIYQIMPGQSDTVQGITLTVVAPPSETQLDVDLPVAGETPTSAVTQAACASVSPEGWVLYEVKAGDNLTFLANRGSVTVEEIMRVNCLSNEIIWIGAPLYVPAQTAESTGPAPACTEVPTGWTRYEIQTGDTLSRIAEQVGVSIQELMEVNCIDSADTIIIGSNLYVPTAP